MANPLLCENVWLQRQKFEEAEAHFYALQAGSSCTSSGTVGGSQVQNRLDDLEKENKDLKKATSDLKVLIQKLEARVAALEVVGTGSATAKASVPSPAPAKPAQDDDDDFDLFGSEEEEEEDAAKAAEKKKLLEEYTAKKSKKPVVIAKSSVVLDVKPWDDETDMAEMEKQVRSIQKDGLIWGAAKLVDLAYGIKKLQIMCTVEDDKISVEDLREDIEAFEDLVQSVDIAAFNKI